MTSIGCAPRHEKPIKDRKMKHAPVDFDLGDKASWSRCHDAYGPSLQTPEDLDKLFSPNTAERKASIRRLYSTLFHQGGRFEATVRATPILFRMLEDDRCCAQDFILRYLVHIGFGHAAYHLPFGINPEAHREALQRQINGDDNWRNRIEPNCSAHTALELFDMIRAERVRLVPFLASPDLAIKLSAIWSVSFWCADDIDAREQLRAMCADAERPVAWSALLALSTMERAMGLRDRDDIASAALASPNPEEALIGAIALADATNIDSLAQTFVSGMSTWRYSIEDYSGDVDRDDPWYNTWGDVRRLVETLLEAYVSELGDVWLSAFAEALDARDLTAAVDTARSLLSLVALDRKGSEREIKPSQLTQQQRRALELIYDCSVWRLEDSGLLNVQTMMRNLGLPPSREGLASLLGNGRT